MSITSWLNKEDMAEQAKQFALVAALRERAKHLKKLSTRYLGLILFALFVGGYLFYKLPMILAGQEQMMNRIQQLSVQQGALEATQKFVSSQWERQRVNAQSTPLVKIHKLNLLSDNYQDLWFATFVDANRGWAVGHNGTILSTDDGGKTWIKQQSGTNHYLFSVEFQDVKRG